MLQRLEALWAQLKAAIGEPLAEMLRMRIYGRRQAFQLVFADTPYTKVVLSTLAEFCHADTTTMHGDARAQCILEGRRQVWLLIAEQLNLPPDAVWELYLERRLTP